MKEIQERLKRAYDILLNLNCTNYNKRLDNQKKVNEAFKEIEKVRGLLKKYE